ncbi:cps6bQ [Streptococcus pneumoniae GA16531]|nr:cps6bQ [Streptococcus pneumoniae GA16531]
MAKRKNLLKVQEKLKLLKEFIKICSKNKMKYFASGGSLLEAARYKGFIPWNDDMALGLPRKHFEKFINEIDFEKYNKNYILESSEMNLGIFQYKLKSAILILGKSYDVCLNLFLLDRMSELVIDGESGFKVPLYNLEVAVDRSRSIIENRELANELGSVAFQRVQSIFEIKEKVSELENIFMSLGEDDNVNI